MLSLTAVALMSPWTIHIGGEHRQPSTLDLEHNPIWSPPERFIQYPARKNRRLLPSRIDPTRLGFYVLLSFTVALVAGSFFTGPQRKQANDE
jgi:hypothetical protein